MVMVLIPLMKKKTRHCHRELVAAGMTYYLDQLVQYVAGLLILIMVPMLIFDYIPYCGLVDTVPVAVVDLVDKNAFPVDMEEHCQDLPW